MCTHKTTNKLKTQVKALKDVQILNKGAPEKVFFSLRYKKTSFCVFYIWENNIIIFCDTQAKVLITDWNILEFSRQILKGRGKTKKS